MENGSGGPATQQDHCPSYAPPENGRELSPFALEFGVPPYGAARKHLVGTSGETLDRFNEMHGLGLDAPGDKPDVW